MRLILVHSLIGQVGANQNSGELMPDGEFIRSGCPYIYYCFSF